MEEKLLLFLQYLEYTRKLVHSFVLEYTAHLYNFVNIISGKYLILTFLLCIYISYTSVNDKQLYASYTSDNYNDYILSKLTNKIIDISKFSIHTVNNKILHPITMFIQNL
jgi:hypothetical protein